jgi:hypothetical protein
MTKARDLANASTALSAVDATELGYLDGVTSNIQTQFGNISGSKAQPSEPSSPTDGMIWVDTDGTAVGNQVIRWSKATANGTTTLSGNDDSSVPLSYVAGYEQVYQNGVLLARGGDYTATNGTSISLTNASVTGDIFEVFASLPVALVDTYTQTQANAAFINDSLLTTTGDTIYASAAGTPARRAIGTTGQVLTVSGGLPTWATPSSGGYTQLATGSLSGSSISLTSISQDYKDLVLYLQNTALSTGAGLRFTFNNNTNSYYGYTYIQNGTSTGSGSSGLPYGYLGDFPGYQDSTSVTMRIPNYTYANSRPHWFAHGGQYPSNAGPISILTFGAINNGTAVSSLQLFPSTGTFSNGTYYLFGVK